MTAMRILIVEDEPFIAMDLEIAVAEIVPAVIVVKRSVASTKEVLHGRIDFAFLDIDVTNGKTYEVAHFLREKQVPFVFVSASSPSALPPELRLVPFIPKPFDRTHIERVLKAPGALKSA